MAAEGSSGRTRGFLSRLACPVCCRAVVTWLGFREVISGRLPESGDGIRQPVGLLGRIATWLAVRCRETATGSVLRQSCRAARDVLPGSGGGGCAWSAQRSGPAGPLSENGDVARCRDVISGRLPENGDFDLQELQGRAGVDIPRAFPTEIGRELERPVLMAPEGGSPDHAVLGFDPEHDRVVLLAAPL